MARSLPTASLFESLENRRLFSTIGLSAAGALTVNGNANFTNLITVAENTAGTSLTAKVVSNGATLTKTFTVAQVKHLNINGGGRADTISVGQSGHAFGIATMIDAKAGADSIHTGAENDSINGGDGNDIIFAGAGNDLVHGGNGADVIHGGDGNDTLWGGAGNDTIYGEAGNDTLGGVLGSGNHEFGGAGSDTFLVSKTLAGSDPVNDFNSAQDKIKVTSTEA